MKKIYYVFSLIDGLTATRPHSIATENFSVASDYSGLLHFHHQNDVKYDPDTKTKTTGSRKKRAIYNHEPAHYENEGIVQGTFNRYIEMTDDMRKLVVDQHNHWRNLAAGGNLPWGETYFDLNGNAQTLKEMDVANGEVNVFAKRMDKMFYDMDLERNSYDWAKKCVWEHSGPMGHDGLKYAYGENLYVTSSVDDANPRIEDATNGWAREFQDYYHSDGSNRGMVGHYTAMIWATSVRVGCAVAICDSMEYISFAGTQVVCQYSGPGNWVGQLPAEWSTISSDVGSNCPNGLDSDYPALCAANGDICASANDPDSNEINRCFTGTCQVDNTLNVINDDPSNWYCNCTENYYGGYCEKDRCSIVETNRGSALITEQNDFFKAMYKLCDGVVSTTFDGSCYAWAFSDMNEALVKCAERSDCKGVVFSTAFGSTYQFLPVHISPQENPEMFSSDEQGLSYFIVRDCSVLLDTAESLIDDSGSENLTSDPETTTQTLIDLDATTSDNDPYLPEFNLLDSNNRIKIGYKLGKCLAISPKMVSGVAKPASSAAKVIIEDCDEINIHQTFIQIEINPSDFPNLLSEDSSSFLICHRPLFETRNLKFCLLNKKNYLKYGRVNQISAAYIWRHTEDGKLYNYGKDMNLLYNSRNGKAVFKRNSFVDFIGSFQ